MDMGNTIKIVMHYLLIGGMVCLDHGDRFPMVGGLVYVIHIRQDLHQIMT